MALVVCQSSEDSNLQLIHHNAYITHVKRRIMIIAKHNNNDTKSQAYSFFCKSIKIIIDCKKITFNL